MIYIKEQPTLKSPGLTALFISCEYNQEIVNILTNIDGRYYHKKDKVWEVPITYLAYILDKLTLIDDIEFERLEEKDIPMLTYNLGECKTHLFKHQIEGIQYGLNKKRWLLLDLPGCGKSLTSIMIAKELKERENIKHCLIICGLNGLKFNWLKEIKQHTDLSACILGQKLNRKGNIVIGSVQERLEHLKNGISEFFVITNIETLRSEAIVNELLMKGDEFQCIIYDEVHRAKDPTSLAGSNLLKLTKAPYLIGLTGTLLLNSPLDAYIPLKWIGVEKSSYTAFKSYYCSYVGPYKTILAGYKNLDYLSYEIQSCSLRRSNYEDLPPLTIIPEYIEMNLDQDHFYNNIVNGIKDEVDKVKLNMANTLALTTRLRQTTACPSILTTEAVSSAKINRACELVHDIVNSEEGGKKVVIFCTFKATVYELARLLEEYNPITTTGDDNDNLVEVVDSFQNSPFSDVFIATWQKAGTGVTITQASYMIFIDTPWTWGAFEQAYKRIHRTGTTKPCFVYELITKNTFDEDVHEILYDKQALSDYVIDQDMSEKVMDRIKKKLSSL